MDIPRQKIGKYEIPVPLWVGGMGVRISGWQLVLAVLKEGCVGTLTSMGLGDLSQCMTYAEFNRTSCAALKLEIEMLKAAMLEQRIVGRPFAVNIMGALSNADDLTRAAVQAGSNIIVYGAGIPLTLPTVVEDADVALVPVISSARLAQLILKRWQRYNRTPDAFIIEEPRAGGHLGFTFEQLEHMDDYSLERIVQETLVTIRPFEDSCGRKIPIIAAGGVYTGEDMAQMFELGATFVQMGTRFVATHECPVSLAFKQAYVNATADDIRIIKTPVGMPGRVLMNPFLQKLQRGKIPKPSCPFHCILSCERDQAGFCIAERLDNSFRGDTEHGLIFTGANVPRIDRIMSVHELITELLDGLKASPRKIPSTL